jgi:hypothetical protein
MNPFLRYFSLGVVSLVLSSSLASAQLSTAQLSGHVTDESGAVLPGVTVTMMQTETGFMRSDVTDGNGAYVLSNLPLGPYRLEVSLQGFRAYVQTGIVLQVGASPEINVELSVGSIEESVTVQGAAPLVDVQSSGISEVVQNEQILALPLNGRNAAELVMIAGAAVQTITSTQRVAPGGMGISVAGGQSFGVAYLLDGAMHNNPQDNLNLPFPFPDALQEFSVATAGLNAQHGMHSGAAVNAVTKSGTNRLAGNAFEFFRDRRFNARNPFAQKGPDGRPVDDGLRRNQFGGTLGGPIVQNKLFFFGAYQATVVKMQPADNIAWVPTPAMLAGDFTTFASPACNGGRQINLGGGFVNNRIDPAQLSPAALNIARRLPTPADPCGQVHYSFLDNSTENQYLGRMDFQRTSEDTIFARYMATKFDKPIPMREGDSPLSLYDAANNRNILGMDALAHSLVAGDTRVFGPNTVNSLRFSFNRSGVYRLAPATFDPYDIGSDVYTYQPDTMVVIITGNGFQVNNPGPSRFTTDASQISNDLTLVRGNHQLAVGGNLAYWKFSFQSHARSGGNWMFLGQLTGLGLADFLTGRVGRLEHGGPALLPMDQWYLGTYAQDTWRVSPRVTLNAGLRWEPYFGQSVTSGAIYNFSLDNFKNNVRSQQYVNAPAGFIYPGDPGFPGGLRGINTQWTNFSPRIGFGWDVAGDGRTAVRASYGLTYDFPNAEYQLINANSPPFGNRTITEDPPGRLDRPYSAIGGDPHPILTNRDTQFIPYGAFGSTDPNLNSPRVQQWNVTIERQLGSVWQVAASYIGSYTDRLWNQVAINPGVFRGTGPCTLQGVFYPVCTTNANLNQRRVFSLSNENPAAARLIGNLDVHDDVGKQSYRGMKLSFQRRGTNFGLSGNYTLSRCWGHPSFQTGGFPQIANGYTNPADPDFDIGYCDQDRTHIGVLSANFLTPQFSSTGMRVAFSDWRVGGILSARSGQVVNIITGQDRMFSGIQNQRVNQVLDNPYGDKKTPATWLNPAAFAQPAPGTFGNFQRNSVRGPHYWAIDMAVSRLVPAGAGRTLELRLEAFNLLNTINWGPPTLQNADRTHHNFNSGAFGRITAMAGAPRIMQFGVKYGF